MGGSGRAKRAMPTLAMMKPSRTWGTRIVLVPWSTDCAGLMEYRIVLVRSAGFCGFGRR